MKPVRQGGGWHSLFYTLRVALRVGFVKLWRSMQSRNACKTCAVGMGGQQGGMVNEKGHWPEVCKKSLQAMASDMQGGIKEKFFNAFSVRKLQTLTSHELERLGRIPFPLYLPKGGSHYRRLSWEDAMNKVAAQFAKTKPQEAFFYFSGRSSNEAGFLLQLLCRLWGTNHVNNCSYYCHQASGVGLSQAIGSGTATITLEDLDRCDLFFLIGGNPSSNHPRLMTSLMELKNRRGQVIVINPIHEPGLSRFSVPSNLRSLFFGTNIANIYVQPKVGGDIALLTGIAKACVEAGTHNKNYLLDHTEGADEWLKLIQELSWQDIIAASGVERIDIERMAYLYGCSKATVFAWTMGITHHTHGVANVQTIVNLALLRGMVGRRGAGLLPIRGHSNVQGMGSMGVTPAIKEEVFERLKEMGVEPPTFKGYDTMAGMEASHAGEMKSAFCLGGNLYASNPDLKFAREAFAKLAMVVYLNTTLNLGHAHGLAEETIILPVLARDEEKQPTTQESMFNYVRYSDGGPERLKDLRSEVEIIAGLGERLLPSHPVVDWRKMRDHDAIRELIARIVPDYESISGVGDGKEEFSIPDRIFHRPFFNTVNGRARVISHRPPKDNLPQGSYRLISLRSEGQFNTVVYENEDVYRGQERRDIILMNAEDMKKQGLRAEQKVEVKGPAGSMGPVLVRPFAIKAGAVAMYYPECNLIIGREVDPVSRTPAFKANAVTVVPV